jgi:hypothetical protein
MKRPDKDLAIAITAGLQAMTARRAEAEFASRRARARTRQRRISEGGRRVYDCLQAVRGSDPFYA